MQERINIAIDGHSSCGKSTIAKNIAKKYNMRYVDTGAMYRAVTFFCLENNLIADKKINIKKLELMLQDLDIIFLYDTASNISQTLLDGINVDSKLRSHIVSQNVSVISQIRFVRNKLIHIQRDVGSKKNVVMDGRDIGTKVLPGAEIKFFITADIEERAKRRFKEQNQQSIKNTFEEIYDNLVKRDEQDSNRKISPLQQDRDAILLDTTRLSKNEQDNLVFSIINKKIKIL